MAGFGTTRRAAPRLDTERVNGIDIGLRVAGSVYEGLLTDYRETYGGEPANSRYRGYMSIPGAWRASVLLSDLHGQMPYHSYKGGSGDNGGGEVRTPKNAPILELPAGTIVDPVTVRASWALDYIWEGNMVGVYTSRSPSGTPTSLLPVAASAVGARFVTDGDGSGLPEGEIEYLIGSRRFPRWDVFHVKGPCEPGALRGMGVLETQLVSLGLSKELQRQATAVTRHGVPTGILRSTNPEAGKGSLAAAKESWLKSQRDRTVAAIGPSIEFQPLSWNPEQLQLIEARKFSLTELELMFGMPVGWLGGATSSRTYSNIEQDAVNLLKFSTLAGMVSKVESNFTLVLPRGTSAKANRDAVLRSDTLTRYQAHLISTGGPWVTVNETRAIENLPPIADGDRVGPKPEPKPEPAPATEPATDEVEPPTTGDDES